jgi:acylphosphatase
VAVDDRACRVTDPTGHARLDATVHGHVQGVGFRMWVRRTASGLGLSGWVRNEPDGGVRTIAEGPRADVDELLKRLRSGPESAWVSGVQEHWEPATGSFDGFTIRSGSHPGD